MAWMLVNPQIHSIFASLGVQQGDSYNVGENCLSNLNEILDKLCKEDRALRTFRRAIAFGQNIKNDLIPLMINVKNDLKIIETTVKILVNLTMPVECLVSTDVMTKTDVGRHTMFELNRLLTTSKETFVDSRSTKAILDYIRIILEKDEKISLEQCECINNCLLLLRNVLHIPENLDPSSGHTSLQNQILWNLFTQSIDKLILHLISHPQQFTENGGTAYWGVTMVQLIALMYKDQHVGMLHKLLNLWFEASLSESSEDNESNTSPPDQGSGDSSPMLTSDPTSDSSDNGGSSKSNVNRINVKNSTNEQSNKHNRNINTNQQLMVRPKNITACMKNVSQRLSNPLESEHKKDGNNISHWSHNHSMFTSFGLRHSSILKNMSSTNSNNNIKKMDCPSVSELSDCGYATQMEKESISTSSNDDDTPRTKPVHQKPHTSQKSRLSKARGSALDKKEWRRKKLIKRSKTHIINMKGLMHHMPTNDDISNILKEFTVDFLLKGYGQLVQELHGQLMSNMYAQIDTSHFFWLVTYFLKFSTQLEMDLEHVMLVLSFDIISYLVFEGVNLCEQLEITTKQIGGDLKPYLRRLHLVVTAIREFLQAVNMYKKLSHISEDDRNYIMRLQLKIASTENLKCLFVLLIRQFNSSIQNQQYLQDLIVTNHIMLIFLDTTSKQPGNKLSISMTDHLKKFATVEIMHQYGLLLENFQNNGEFVNDCVFTMMHHVGGDLNKVSTLFQPIILKTFSLIWETDYEICDDWADLIEFVIHKFINTPRTSPLTTDSCSILDDTRTSSEKNWNEEEIIKLKQYYDENQHTFDPISNMVKSFEELGVIKSKFSILHKLYEQGLINMDTYNDWVKGQNVYNDNNIVMMPQTDDNDIIMLREILMKDNFGSYIKWLQKVLLDACYVKIRLLNQKLNSNADHIMEPIPHYFSVMKRAIPIVAWSYEETQVLSQLPFVLLMHKIGFHLSSDTGLIFPRVPEFWTAEVLFNVALKLGPIDKSMIYFDINLINKSIEKVEEELSSMDDTESENFHYLSETFTPVQPVSMIRFTPLPNPPTNWLQTVIATNASNMVHSESDKEISVEIPDDFIPIPIADEVPIITMVETKMKCEINDENENYFFEKMDCMYSVKADSPMKESEHIGTMSETASVVSDLTRMYVSDEEEKL